MSTSAEWVRPTRSCLAELGEPVPHLGVRLSELEHPLVIKAQQVPALAAQHSAERIRSLTDRVWLKVKTSSWRGAAANLNSELPPAILQFRQHWWLGSGGKRQADSPQSDFYARLSDRAFRAGPNSCSTDFLLPTDWDVKRLIGEAGVNGVEALHTLVLQAAAQSLLNSDIRVFVVGDREVKVRIKMLDDGEVYLAIGARGSVDPTFIVSIISAIPNTGIEEWLPEPTGSLQIEPEAGEIVWSTILSPEAQSLIANHGDGLD